MKKTNITAILVVFIIVLNLIPKTQLSFAEDAGGIFVNQNFSDGLYERSKMHISGGVSEYIRDKSTNDIAALFYKQSESELHAQISFLFNCSSKLVLETEIFLDNSEYGMSHIFLLHSPDGIYTRNLLLGNDGSLISGCDLKKSVPYLLKRG